MTESPSSPISLRFWQGFLVTLRPYLMFLSLAAGMTGLALTELGPSLGLYAVVFFATYGLGQAVTDTFQTDTDELSAPYRPLVRHEVGVRDVRTVALIGLGVCAAVFVIANPWNAVPAVASVVGLVTYTWFKRRWWGGPPWNAWIVALLPLMGMLSGGATPAEALSEPKLWLVMLSVFATYVCFVLLGYLKDVEADAATGYDTLPVRFGRKATVIVSALHGLVGLGASTYLVSTLSTSSVGALVFWGTGWLALAVAHARLWSVSRDDAAHPGVALSALAFVGIHLAESALLRADLFWWALGAFALSVVAMSRRPSREQV